LVSQPENAHLANRLLAALQPDDLDLLLPHLTASPLVRDRNVFHSGEPAPHVWFPHSGVISIVAEDSHGAAIEVATIGREGMTGLPFVLGSETMANSAMVQVAGHGSRMTSQAFRQALEHSASLTQMMQRQVLAVITQISQNVACNQLHSLNARCARWLLMTHDRVDGAAFELTQEYLAMMLGVTRPSVSAAASTLQKAGLIRYSRGQITVLDRTGLEAASCECYGIVDRELTRLLGLN
jgi:CRP-like cAMP-binding protein